MYYSVRIAHRGAFLPQGQEVGYKFCTWLGAGGVGLKFIQKLYRVSGYGQGHTDKS